jgi:intein-encoded DNA endonuclease-like protein
MHDFANELRLEIESLNIKRCRRSKLDPFKKEILTLRHVGLSYQRISYWLQKEKCIKISANGLNYMINKVWSPCNENTKPCSS